MTQRKTAAGGKGGTPKTSAPLPRLVTELRQVLAEAGQRPSDSYREAVGLLHGFAEQVSEFLNGAERAPAEVIVELGHVVDQGQEHRIVIRAPAIGLQDYLLRAYVPFDGFPVTLDAFGDEDNRAESPDDLVRSLVALMRRPDTMDRLLVIRQSLGDPSLHLHGGGGGHVGSVRKPAPKARKR